MVRACGGEERRVKCFSRETCDVIEYPGVDGGGGNFEIDLSELGWEGTEWIDLA
jgi:hypothetical protein